MLALGIVLVLVGAALLVAEAHAPAGVLGVGGGLSLAGGAALAIAAAGGGLAIVLAVAVGAGAVAGLWLAVGTRKALATRALRSSAGREALSGRLGVVRNWRDGGYLERVPVDPWDGPYLYATDGRSYVLRSLGADGKEGGDGYDADIDSRDF